MASLFSAPRTAPIPRPVAFEPAEPEAGQTPQPAPAREENADIPRENENATGDADSTTREPADSGEASGREDEQLRAASLLSRRRGRTGTIATSFRGLLEPGSFRPQRRTLLGE